MKPQLNLRPILLAHPLPILLLRLLLVRILLPHLLHLIPRWRLDRSRSPGMGEFFVGSGLQGGAEEELRTAGAGETDVADGGDSYDMGEGMRVSREVRGRKDGREGRNGRRREGREETHRASTTSLLPSRRRTCRGGLRGDSSSSLRIEAKCQLEEGGKEGGGENREKEDRGLDALPKNPATVAPVPSASVPIAV
jgi:hypothetical protein